jgi:hypothetical protein
MKIHFWQAGAVRSAAELNLPLWHSAIVARRSAHANRNLEPHGYSFDDSRHPVWAIANGIVIFFLSTSAVGFLLLIADAFLTRT